MTTASGERTFAYNSLSQLTSASNPESGTVSYAYDNDGNLLTKTDARAITTTDAYDQLQRLTGKTFSNGDPAISYFYDQTSYNGLTIANGIGRRTGMSDAAGAEAWSYDPMGRVLAERRTTNAVTKSTSYAYNLDASMASLTYPSGRVITYTPSAAGRPVSAVDTANGVNYALSVSYAPQGALASLLLGQTASFSGINLNQGYNNRLQPSSIVAWSTNGTALNLGYNFDLSAANTACLTSYASPTNNGNVAVITNNLNTARTQTYCYDELNRIKTAQTQVPTGQYAWGLSFGYDMWANLLSATVSQCSAPMVNVGVNTQNHITNTGFSYDAAGNVLSDGSFSYAYDAENRTKTAAGVNYTYDGDGKRVWKANGTQPYKLYWYGMGSDVLDETDATGSVTTGTFNEYVFFGGKRIARRDSSTNVFFYFEDHLGTSRVITQANGAPCYDADFYPFGGETTYTNTCPQNYKFTGKERDSESGLDDFGARYMSSSMGRFMSPDPVFFQASMLTDPQRFNQYAYARNNPLAFVDPTGEAIELTGDEAQRKKELEELQKTVGQQAGSYLYENAVTTTDANGNTTTQYFVGIYTNGPSGNGPAFENTNSVAGEVSAIIKDTNIAQLAVVPAGVELKNDFGQKTTLNADNPGATGTFGGFLRVNVLDPSTKPANLPGDLSSTGKPLNVTTEDVLGHELGHARARMTGAKPRSQADNDSAVRLENKVRTLRNPNAPTRTQHDPPQ